MKANKIPQKKMISRYRFNTTGFFGADTTTTTSTNTDPTSGTTLSTTHIFQEMIRYAV